MAIGCAVCIFLYRALRLKSASRDPAEALGLGNLGDHSSAWSRALCLGPHLAVLEVLGEFKHHFGDQMGAGTNHISILRLTWECLLGPAAFGFGALVIAPRASPHAVLWEPCREAEESGLGMCVECG